jgi:heme-degrading monooxygenase HmoA
MYVVIWEFRVKPGRESEFELAYGPDGPWTALFRRDSGYLGTELLEDAEKPGRYLTIDRWVSSEAFEAFTTGFADEYEAIDRLCEDMTLDESRVGIWRPVADPA